MTPSERPQAPRPRGWKHGAIPVIGLIGGIGSGKSQVAHRLASRGATVIDADAAGHRWLRDPQVRGEILHRFGPSVMAAPDTDGTAPAEPEPTPPVDRRALGAIVFADPVARRALEAILHPRMRDEFRSAINRAVRDGDARLVVLDAAVLLEAGWDDLCDRIVFVDAPRPERGRRVAEARGWSEATFNAREHAQWPVEEKRRRADWILTNDAESDRLDVQVDHLLTWLREFAPPAGSATSPPPDPLILGSPTVMGRMA